MNEMSIEKGEDMNSVFMMADSGARGSTAQMKQLAGMRGLMAKLNGEIIETPIISNFKEGLSVLEYFNSTHLLEKVLGYSFKTANSGYLTRRLVDEAQDLTLLKRIVALKASKKAVIDAGEVIESLEERIVVEMAEDLKNPDNDDLIAKMGDFIDEDLISKIGAEIDSVKVRSFTCALSTGMCYLLWKRSCERH